MTSTVSWADGRLCAISVETTGGDDERARLVAIAMVFIGDNPPIDDVRLLINPGIAIPVEATSRHHITTEWVKAEGIAPAEALQTIRNRLQGCWGSGDPLIGFDIMSTLTVLDREMRRHLGVGLAVTGPVVDPHLIDRVLDRAGRTRSLPESCRHYEVRHDSPHDAVANAYAAARLAWRLARRHPKKIGNKPLMKLHQQQLDWAPRNGRPGWPLRPNSTVDPRWTNDVFDAIHAKIRDDWEATLRKKGPLPFRTELHIVNDTLNPDPYFTSVRVLPNNMGHNDTFLIAYMGELAQAMAADRVVIAWEPGSLQLATLTPGAPLPAAERTRALHVLDVVHDTATRLCRYPFTRPTRDGTTPFSWGTTEVVDRPGPQHVVRDLVDTPTYLAS